MCVFLFKLESAGYQNFFVASLAQLLVICNFKTLFYAIVNCFPSAMIFVSFYGVFLMELRTVFKTSNVQICLFSIISLCSIYCFLLYKNK